MPTQQASLLRSGFFLRASFWAEREQTSFRNSVSPPPPRSLPPGPIQLWHWCLNLMSQSLLPLTFSNSIWHPRQASGESQGPELAPKMSGLLSARRGTWILSQGLGRQGKFGAVASQLRRLHSGAGGAGSKQARLDGRDKGLLVRPRPPPTPQISLWAAAAAVSPAGEEAFPHSRGFDSRMSRLAPAPRSYPAGDSGREGGALPILPQLGTFSSVLPAPAGWMKSNEVAVVRGI